MTPEKYTDVSPYSRRNKEASVNGRKQAINPAGRQSTRTWMSMKYDDHVGG